MKGIFSNSILALVLTFGLCAGLSGQEAQAPASSSQPQNEPAPPGQSAPQQQSPKEQPQTQPSAQSPNATQPQGEPAQPGQAAPDQTQPKEMPPSRPQKETPQSVAPTQSPSSPPKPKTATTAKSKPARRKRTPAPKTPSTTQGGKVVVRNGSVRESTTQISPGVNDQQAQQQRSVTNQLLATTDANIKKMTGRQLTSTQQSMLDQVNTYVRQSKAAADTGDISRAHTLAVKAQLLSNELARR